VVWADGLVLRMFGSLEVWYERVGFLGFEKMWRVKLKDLSKDVAGY
jgi:hypothetical protein